MGRKKSTQPSKTIRVWEDAFKDAHAASLYQGEMLIDFVSEILRRECAPIIKAGYENWQRTKEAAELAKSETSGIAKKTDDPTVVAAPRRKISRPKRPNTEG